MNKRFIENAILVKMRHFYALYFTYRNLSSETIIALAADCAVIRLWISKHK